MKKSMSIPLLCFPFSGIYPVSFPFGEMPDSEVIRKKYRECNIKGHDGVDFALPVGTNVLAAAKGTVVLAGENGDFGISVTIDHSWGTTLYAHLQEASVTVGQKVKRGEVIGVSGQTGFVTGPHLHFGLKLRDADEQNGYFGYVNPVLYCKEK